MARPKNTRSKIESNIDKSGGPDACWPWPGHTDKDGYPLATMDYKTYGVHRLMLSWYTGTDGVMALHSCDNPICCNPNHLRWGTAKDNADDRDIRQRGMHGKTKINDAGRASQSKRISKKYRLVGPDGTVYTGLNLKEFCESQGLYYIEMTYLCRGKRAEYKGWTGSYVEEVK